MKKKSLFKSISAGLLLISTVVILGLVGGSISGAAAAGDVTENEGVVIVSYTNIGEYREAGNFKAPSTPSGYSNWIFAGWYTDESLAQDKALRSSVVSDNIDASTIYYAKFVPKAILGVRMQVTPGTNYDKSVTNTRFITSVDSLDYEAVGFEVAHNGQTYSAQSNTVYKKLYAMDENSTVMNTYTPEKVFHETSEYFLAAKLSNVANAKFGDAIQITPYWVTLDGTKVSGETVNKTVNESYTKTTTTVAVDGYKEIALPTKTYRLDTVIDDGTTSGDSTNYHAQGGCKAGDYYYQAFVAQTYEDGNVVADENNYVRIAKFDLSGNYQSMSEKLKLEHANDMTYNPNLSYTDDASATGLIVIVQNVPYLDRISFVDPDTLTIVNPSSITNKGTAMAWDTDDVVTGVTDTYLTVKKSLFNNAGVFAIEYNELYDKYVVGLSNSKKIRFLNADFSRSGVIHDTLSASINLTTQGISADDKYIYMILSNVAEVGGQKVQKDLSYAGNVIMVYDWNGNYVRTIDIPNNDTNGIPMLVETENISVDDNKFYIVTRAGQENSANKARLYQLETNAAWTTADYEAYIGSTGYTTLQKAVDAVQAGQTIDIVAEHIEINDTLTINKNNVTIQNQANKKVIIRRGASLCGVLINNTAEGFKLQENLDGGNLILAGGEYLGDAYISNANTLTLSNVDVFKIKTNSDTGAIYNTAGTLTVTGGHFRHNETARYGAVINVGGGTLNVSGGKYEGNSAKQGGAIYIASGTSGNQISGATFTLNDAPEGGALFTASSIRITGSTFGKAGEANTATYGGAINVNGNTTVATISNTKFTANTVSARGGAIYNGGSATTKLLGTSAEAEIFSSNSAKTDGGAIGVGSGELYVEGYTFSGNKATALGGAIYGSAKLEIETATFDTNSADSHGGAIYEYQKNAIISDSRFTNNTAKGNGGAFYMNGTGTLDGAEATMTDCKFDTNSAANGGAIYNASSGTTTLRPGDNSVGAIFNNNSTTATDNGGGAIRLGSGKLNITGYTFTNNTSKLCGGAIYTAGATTITDAVFGGENAGNTTTGSSNSFGGAIYVESNTTTITDSKFDSNTAVNGGGAIYNQGTTTLKVDDNSTNAIINNNSTGDGKGGAINSEAELTVTGYRFTKNTASSHGGAIHSNKKITITGSTFGGSETEKNQSTGGNGGAIYLYNNEATIKYSEFNSNTAGSGGAIYARDTKTNTKVISCKFVSNTAKEAGAIYLHKYGTSAELTLEVDSTSAVTPTLDSNQATAGSGGAIIVASGAELNVDGYTFTKNETPDSGSYDGGAVYTAGTTTIENAIFGGENSANTAARYGGAIIVAGGTTEITDSKFDSNTAVSGGGAIYNQGTLTLLTDNNADNAVFTNQSLTGTANGGAIGSETTLNVTGYLFTKNRATSHGGAIYSRGATTITNAVFGGTELGNVASGKGGAIYVQNTTTSITDSTFDSNTAVSGGGAIYVRSSDNGIHSTTLDIANNSSMAIFNNNKSTSSKGGGAIYVEANGTLNVTGYTFTNNQVTKTASNSVHGGAIYTNSAAEITNSTFTNNKANNHGGALYFNGNGKTTDETRLKAEITDSKFNLNRTVSESGGAIYCATSGAISLQGTNETLAIFDDNYAKYMGGAIRIGSGVLSVSGYKFTNNEAANDGGAIQHNQAVGEMNVSNCIFDSNKSNTNGGAIRSKASTTDIKNSKFTGNSATTYGGAIHSSDSATLTITGTDVDRAIFANNQAEYRGGAIQVNSGKLKVSGYQFNNNSTTKATTSTGEGGGAIKLNSSVDFDIQNTSFANNRSSNLGGAIHTESSTRTAAKTLTFTGNTATNGGNHVYNGNATGIMLEECTVGATYNASISVTTSGPLN